MITIPIQDYVPMLSPIALYSGAGKHLRTQQNASKRRKTPQNAVKYCKTPQNAAKRSNVVEVVANSLQNAAKIQIT